jgi:hypothetical protein
MSSVHSFGNGKQWKTPVDSGKSPEGRWQVYGRQLLIAYLNILKDLCIFAEMYTWILYRKDFLKQKELRL